MSITEAPQSNAFVSDLLRGRYRRWALEIVAVALGVIVVALLARVSIPVGPVPITGQTLGVLLVGASYGATRGAATMTAYMTAGLLGVPVFAGAAAGPASVFLPSFGFIVGFIPCAWVVGWFADRGWDRSVWKGAAANTVASIIPFVVGVPYMVIVLSIAGTTPTFPQAMEWGVVPFIPGGIAKAVLAACALPVAWAVRRRFVSVRGEEQER